MASVSESVRTRVVLKKLHRDQSININISINSLIVDNRGGVGRSCFVTTGRMTALYLLIHRWANNSTWRPTEREMQTTTKTKGL